MGCLRHSVHYKNSYMKQLTVSSPCWKLKPSTFIGKRIRVSQQFNTLQIMPYIFVRGTLSTTGLFSNETFIDFQNVEDGNGEFVGGILSRQFGGAYHVTEHKNGYPQKGPQMQWPLSPDTFRTIGVDMQPTVVLNRLEIHAGYKVVAANQQRPLPIHRCYINNHQGLLPSCPVSYTLWTLHKPLPWNITANALKFNSYQLFFTFISTFVVLPVLPVGLSC